MSKVLLVFSFIFFSTFPVFAQSIDTAWVRRYNGPGNGSDEAYAIAVDGSGSVYVAGQSIGSGTDWDYATIKYYQNGDTAWIRRYNCSANGPDYAEAIDVDVSGNVYVTGSRCSVGGTGVDYATIKYYPNGDTAWVRTYNGPGNDADLGSAIAVDNSANVYVTGQSWGGLTGYDYATVKYYSGGDTAWVRRYNGPGDSSDAASAIAVDGSGNVYVTGLSVGSGTYGDYATIKYNPNGDTAWVRRYNGPGDSTDWANSIAVDNSGNVYVTGFSYGIATSEDYATIKYYPNGDTAWVRRYNGPASTSDFARAIAVDNSGNVYVTGLSYGSGTGEDYCTIKYKPNGDTAWVRRYNGPGNAGDDAHAIAVDGAGNVYVTGESFGSGANYDYATIKYDPDGNVHWVKRYNGPANGHDHSYAMALDGFANVYVTGESYGIGTDYDYATIKYRQFQQRNDTLWVFAYSPVDLIVTDPIGRWISADSNYIPGATYDTTTDRNHDGERDDIVTIPNPILGNYLVGVVAEPGVDTGHYTEAIKLDGNEEACHGSQCICSRTRSGRYYSLYSPRISAWGCE